MSKIALFLLSKLRKEAKLLTTFFK